MEEMYKWLIEMVKSESQAHVKQCKLNIFLGLHYINIFSAKYHSACIPKRLHSKHSNIFTYFLQIK